LAVKKAREQGLAISDKTVKKAKKILEVAKEDPEIASLFSVSTRTIENWTRDLREKEKEELERSIFDLWLSCWSYEEIAKKLGVSLDTINKVITFAKRKFSQNESEPPESLRIYDVWNFSKCDERLLYDERDS
jgi:transposase